MAYCTPDDVKMFSQNDDLNVIVLETLVDAVQESIDGYCRRSFAPVAGARLYDFQDGRRLDLDTGLVSLTSVTTNGGQTLASGDFLFEPKSGPPYTTITLTDASGKTFQFGATAENAITVTGVWGYKAAVPAAIKMAAIMWVLDIYNKRDVRGYSSVTAGGANAQLAAPSENPPLDVLPLLRPYRRIKIGRLANGSGISSLTL